MSQLLSTIRPAPGADGPFYVVTEMDGTVSNVTVGIANLNAALDQCKTDQGALLGALTVRAVKIQTTAV